MAEFLFWEPYNKAKLYADFRDLIKAIEANDPMALHPDVLKLLAEQVKNPRAPSRRTQGRDGWGYAEEVLRLKTMGEAPSEYAARKMVLSKYPDLNDETLKTYCRSYKQALKAHRNIIEENQ
ncbi:hypothetical protein [Paenirhodobacter sp.]|uniref:hypothetical protein n=1 Tax=Paenirhodobacter sp. TaxID=1965326 RepID=UPI003B506EAE